MGVYVYVCWMDVRVNVFLGMCMRATCTVNPGFTKVQYISDQHDERPSVLYDHLSRNSVLVNMITCIVRCTPLSFGEHLLAAIIITSSGESCR